MKAPNIFACASVLTVAGTLAGTQDAHAANPDQQLKEGLREAICFQDWNKAVELSSVLMASPRITPEHRQTLVDWRYRFSKYALDGTKFDEIPNCEGVKAQPIQVIQPETQYKSTPSFSTSSFNSAVEYYCYQTRNSGYVENLEYMCQGPQVEPPPPPIILSNGDLECSFLSGISSSSLAGAGETISVPAVCRALRTVRNVSVKAQLKAGNRVLGTDEEFIEYIEQGETYAYEAEFSTDFASDPGESLSLRFIP